MQVCRDGVVPDAAENCDQYGGADGVAGGAYAYRLNARVVMMGAAEEVNGTGLLRWEFANCLPIKLKAADLSSSSTEIGIEELHLNHEGMRLMGEGEA